MSPAPLSLQTSALVPPLQLAPKPLSAKRLHKRRVLQGFRLQSAPIVELLDEALHRFESQGVSAIVEGVHLSVDSMIELCRRHTSAVPLLVYISNERKHLERFAVRSRHMTLNPIQNKYTKLRLSEFHTEPIRYPDEMMRTVALCTSALVVCCFISTVVAVVSSIALFKFRMVQMFEPFGFSVVGKGIGSVRY